VFYFQQLLNTALAGIDRTSMIPTVTGIAYAILLIGFLVGLYQAALRGGDVQALAVTGIKYLAIALILANWSSAFRQVNTGFNDVSQFIGNSSGAGDMFASWMDQLKQQYDTQGNLTIWDMITGAMAGEITGMLLIVAYILYACAVVIFSFFYTLYGCVLYVLGPLVLALLPMAGVGQLAKTYATNLMIWNAWSLLYSTFGALMTAVQVNQVSNILNKQGFIGFFQGLGDSSLLGLVSIFYALALALIPLIARRLISGEVGGTVFSLVKSAAMVAGYALAGAAGFSAEAGQGTSAASGAGASASVSTTAATTSQAAAVSSVPPPAPSVADTIRSGMMSAMGVGKQSASAPTGGGSGSGKGSGSGSGSGKSSRSPAMKVTTMQPGSTFHPRGVMQTISYQAGRVAGGAVRAAAQSSAGQPGAGGEKSNDT